MRVGRVEKGRKGEGWGGVGGVVLPHYSRSAGVPAAMAPLPTALARPRRRTESRPTSFISPASTEVTRGRSAARIQSPGVTDGVADQPSLKVFHLFFILGKRKKKIKKLRPQAHFPRRPPPGRLYGYVRRPRRCCACLNFYCVLMKLPKRRRDCLFIAGLLRRNMPALACSPGLRDSRRVIDKEMCDFIMMC